MSAESTNNITDEQWWAICDCHSGRPIPLKEADLSLPFVYERRWGVFYVSGGYHPLMISTLLAFQHEYTNGIDVARKLGLDYPTGTSDYWLEHTKGAAFRSSVGNRIQIARFNNLTIQERRLFGDADCVFP